MVSSIVRTAGTKQIFMSKQQITPEFLRTLKPNQQLQKVTLLFFEKAANNLAFAKGKPTHNFFAVRTFFGKQTLESLHLIYDFLWQYKGEQKLSLGECFNKSREYQEKLRWDNKSGTKEVYKDFKDLLEEM